MFHFADVVFSTEVSRRISAESGLLEKNNNVKMNGKDTRYSYIRF